MKDGTVMDLNGEVNVIGQEDIVDKIEDKEKVKNLWQKTGDFFSNLWNWIVKYLGFGWLWDKDNKYNPTW